MRIESKLCHISENKVIVQVNGWINDHNLGSALAEGPTVEIAEDKAISRLNKRINIITTNETNTKSTNADANKTTPSDELSKRQNDDSINVKQEPSDWSNELTAIDSELKRLKWSRDDEVKFLEKNFGHNNRSKITAYIDIIKYLDLLRKIDVPNQINENHNDFNSLIEESDIILKELSWNNTQGREYLQKEFNVSTRMELTNEQLISFVEKLKLIRNQFLTY